MGNFKSLKETKEYFKNDRFATNNGMILEEVNDEYALCSVELNDNHKNAYGGIMGGVIFTLADFAFAIASNNNTIGTVAQQVSINYLSAPKGKKLYAKAVCKKDGRTTCVYNVDVTDDTGRAIAQFIGSGYKTKSV